MNNSAVMSNIFYLSLFYKYSAVYHYLSLFVSKSFTCIKSLCLQLEAPNKQAEYDERYEFLYNMTTTDSIYCWCYSLILTLTVWPWLRLPWLTYLVRHTHPEVFMPLPLALLVVVVPLVLVGIRHNVHAHQG